jgi:hypothetical protein
MQINYKPLIIAMSAMALSACNDNNDHHNVDHTAPAAQVQTAYFIDSTISGLRYNSGSQQGVTGTDGKFNYQAGETVTFKLGDITLGTAKPTFDQLLLKSLNNGTTEQGNLSNSSINRAVLLQTLDQDADSSNGIQLASTMLAQFKNTDTLDFNTAPDQFAQQLGSLLAKLNIASSVVDAALAKDNLLLSEAKAMGKVTLHYDKNIGSGLVSRVERHIIPDVYVPYHGADASLKQYFPKGFPLAVGSGLSFIGTQNGVSTFYAITDRGPNADSPLLADSTATKVFPAPQFAPTLVKLSVDQNGVKLASQLELSLNGKKITGLPLPAGSIGSSNEAALSEDLKTNLGTDINGLDTEAITLDADNKHGWICDEYGPFVAKIELASGKIVEKFGPGTGLPALIAKRQPNRGCEGLAYDSGKLYAIVQSTLDISKNSALFTRLVEFDPQTRTSKTYAYPITPADWQDGKAGKAKLGDLLALGNGRFMTIEQGTFADNKIHNKLYVFDIKNATDISNMKSGEDELEKIKDPAKLLASGVRTASKTYLLDLKDYGWLMEKAEGLTLIDATTLAISNDNDFGLRVDARDKAGNSVDATELSVNAQGQLTDEDGNTGYSYKLVANKPEERHSQLWYIKLTQPVK